jgi:hypothetical protein
MSLTTPGLIKPDALEFPNCEPMSATELVIVGWLWLKRVALLLPKPFPLPIPDGLWFRYPWGNVACAAWPRAAESGVAVIGW